MYAVTEGQDYLPHDGRAFYRVSEVCRMLGVSRGKVETLLRDGRLEGLMDNRTRLIPRASIERYIASLPTYFEHIHNAA